MIVNRKEGGSIQHSILTLTEIAQHEVGIEPTTFALPGVSSMATTTTLKYCGKTCSVRIMTITLKAMDVIIFNLSAMIKLPPTCPT